MLKSIIILVLTLFSALHAEPQAMTPEQIRKDFEAQQSDKYRNDTLETTLPQKLISGLIVKPDFVPTVNDTSTVDCQSFMNNNFTSSIYNIDAVTGMVTCVYAKVGKIYAPQGLFNVFYPQLKSNYKQNTELAKQANAAIIAQKNTMTQELRNTKNEISASINNAEGRYLNIPQLLTSAILTDIDIINAPATQLTGQLQLHGEYTSAFTSGGEINDNGRVLKGEIINLFTNYASISSIVISYIWLIGFFVMIFTGAHIFLSKIEKNDKTLKLRSFGVLAFVGFLAFAPFTSLNEPGQNEEFEIASSNFQKLERRGYYLFSEVADELAKAITNNQLDTLINKSGVGTEAQIVSSAAGLEQTQKLIDYHTNLHDVCTNTFDNDYIVPEFGTATSKYPQSEKWAYALSIYQPSAGLNYYNKSPEGLVKDGSYSQFALNAVTGTATISDYYPVVSFSFCRRNDNLLAKYKQQNKNYKLSYEKAIETDPNSDQKISILKTLVRFQYELWRQYGYLSILGLPVTVMQTEANEKLYQKDPVTKKLEERIGNSDFSSGLLNSFISSMPYLLVPGASAIYQNTTGVIRDLAQGGKDTVVGSAFGWFGGNVAASVASNATAFTISYQIVVIMLQLLPIVGVAILGLLRFLTIIIKIFTMHFGCLLLFPIIFIQQNGEAMKSFTVKLLTLMLEVPLFILSVWLAITANSLFHAIGDIFSKEIILGMLDNNAAGVVKEWSFAGLLSVSSEFFETLKIYFLNGFMEVAISVFSIIIIYKIIISWHSELLSGLELKSFSVLDDAIGNVRNEMNFQGKI